MHLLLVYPFNESIRTRNSAVQTYAFVLTVGIQVPVALSTGFVQGHAHGNNLATATLGVGGILSIVTFVGIVVVIVVLLIEERVI